MKKVLSMILVLGMLLALCACGSNANTGDEEQSADSTDEAVTETSEDDAETDGESYVGKTLTIALDEEPATLLPQAGTPTSSVQDIAAVIFPYLMDYDENGEIKYNLCTGYEWEDEQTCILHIREGVLASDGTPFTAEDVIYSFRLGLEGSNPASYSDLNTEEWYAEDDYTVVCKFAEPYPLFTTILTNDYTSIVSESVMESLGGMDAAGLNPSTGGGYYNFVEWVPGQYILLEYNEDYWDDSYVPNYQYIKLNFIADSASRGLAVQSGDVDVALEVGLSNTLAYEDDPNVEIQTVDAPSVTMLWLNCSSEYLQDEAVREGISYLIDFDALNQIMSNNMAPRCRTSVPASSPYYYDGTEQTTYDAEKGIQILEDAGYGDGFELYLFSEPTEGYSDACELIQYYLSLANINVTIEYANQTNYFDTVQNYQYDMLLTGISGNMVNFMAAYFDNTEDASIKCGGVNYSDEQLREWSNIITTTFDETERTEAFVNIQKMCIDEYLCLGVCSGVDYHLSRAGVGNFVPGAAGNVLLQYIK